MKRPATIGASEACDRATQFCIRHGFDRRRAEAGTDRGEGHRNRIARRLGIVIGLDDERRRHCLEQRDRQRLRRRQLADGVRRRAPRGKIGWR